MITKVSYKGEPVEIITTDEKLAERLAFSSRSGNGALTSKLNVKIAMVDEAEVDNRLVEFEVDIRELEVEFPHKWSGRDHVRYSDLLGMLWALRWKLRNIHSGKDPSFEGNVVDRIAGITMSLILFEDRKTAITHDMSDDYARKRFINFGKNDVQRGTFEARQAVGDAMFQDHLLDVHQAFYDFGDE